MKSAILSVGTELLFGEITNTNTVYLSRQLNLLGFDVLYHYTVGDNPDRLRALLELALKECDLIITTGGLGPTQDDLTKETVCSVLGDNLILHQPSMDWIYQRYASLGRQLTENNKKQAYLPSQAEVFHNDAGSAPGFALEKEGKCIICLPGPPREMTRLFEKKALPYLERKTDSAIYSKMIRTFGIGESLLETELMDLIDGQTDPTLATYAKEGECCLRIASKRKSRQEAEDAVMQMLEQVKARTGDYIYSCDDEELVDVVAKKLLKKNISLACAESCTGGLFAGTLTGFPGISGVFSRGYVTYSNEAKMEILGVKEETLRKYGAVSPETAMEMAEGAARISKSDIAVSVTGIAGPDGGTPEKPVGLVYMGACFKGKALYRQTQMRNINRNWNRQYSVLSMLDWVNRIIDEW